MGVFEDWLAHMTRSGPAEGWRGGEYLILWPANLIPGLNEAYQVATHAPGRAIFASNGCDDAFAFDSRSEPHRIVRFFFVGMGDRTQQDEASTFAEFIKDFTPGDRRGVPADHEVSFIQPLVFGGPPDRVENRQVLARDQHVQIANFWNDQLARAPRRPR